jgi:general secretion pathway protein G
MNSQSKRSKFGKRLFTKSLKRQGAFTLVEMIVVLVIISLLMGFLLKGIFSGAEGAKAKLTEMKMEKLKSSINQYNLMNNRVPSTLSSLVTCDSSKGKACVKLADPDDLKDAWDTEFRYQVGGTGKSYTLKSLGSDGREGGSDTNSDISVEGP